MMKPEIFISLRYFWTKRKEKFIWLISAISILGVAIGVCALIVVIAVMTGFDKDLRDKIVGNYAHILISKDQPIKELEYKTLSKKLLNQPHVVAVSPYILGQVFMQEEERFFSINLKGINIEEEIKTSNLKKYLRDAKPEDLKDNCVFIGKELSQVFGLTPKSNITVFSPSGRKFNLEVSGLFHSGMYEYDLHLALVNLKTAQEIFGLEDTVQGLALKLDNLYLAEKVKANLLNVLDEDYNIKTWIQMNQNFFAALKLEKFTMFVILTLIILVATFNIASTLIVMVVEKTRDIGILKALGFTAKSIKRIFSFVGLFIGLSGVLLGLIMGFTLCYLLTRYQFIKLPQDIYYIDRLPVAIELWPDIILIVVCAVLISFISTIYPARKASKLLPTEALRYE